MSKMLFKIQKLMEKKAVKNLIFNKVVLKLKILKKIK